MSQADEVRIATDIVKLVGEYVKLRKAGTNWVGLCPFHREKTPSFSVHPAKQIFHCFGCGVGGNAFRFVMLIENLSFPEALRRLAERAGMTLAAYGEGAGDDQRSQERRELYQTHEVAARFYASQLSATAEGRAAAAYLADRGLGGEMIARFRLGYAPQEGQALTRHLAAAGISTATLEKSGLVLKSQESERRFDRFRRRVIFPIANDSGKIVAFGGRALADDTPKYLNSPETPIYSKGRVLYNLHPAGPSIRKLDFAVLVEGYMDTIAVVSAGVENVVASCGTSLTESQVRLLGRYTRQVVVNFDPDSAGTAATERSLGLLLEEGYEVKVLVLTGGMDPDSFIRRNGRAAYHQRLAAAPSYLDYLMDRAMAAQDVSTPGGKVAAANALLPYLARIPNPLLRAEWGNRLAERLRLEDRLFREELDRAVRAANKQTLPQQGMQALHATPAEKELLRGFLEDPMLAGEFLGPLLEEGLAEGLATERIFRGILTCLSPDHSIDMSQLENTLKPEERRLVSEAQFLAGDSATRDHVLACLQALERRKAERDRERLQTAIRGAEKAHDVEGLSRLLEAKAALLKARPLSPNR